MSGLTPATGKAFVLFKEGAIQVAVLMGVVWHEMATLAASAADISLQTGVASVHFMRQTAQAAITDARGVGIHDAVGLQCTEALRLRRSVELRGFIDTLAAHGIGVDDLSRTLRKMPGPVAAAVAFVVLRSLATLNALADTVLHEILYGRTLLARMTLVGLATPGWLALYYYREGLLQGLESRSHVSGRGAMSPRWEQILRNVSRLPPLAWLAVATSGTVATQVVKEFVTVFLKFALQLRFRTLIGGATILALAEKGIKNDSVQGLRLDARRRTQALADSTYASLVHPTGIWQRARVQLSGGLRGQWQRPDEVNDEGSEPQVPDAISRPLFTGPAASSASMYTLTVRIIRIYRLRNNDPAIRGDILDPYVVARLGTVQHRTPAISSELTPEWSIGNEFTFEAAPYSTLQLDVMDERFLVGSSLGKTRVELRDLKTGRWSERRDDLEGDCGGVLEFELRLDRT